MKVDVLEFRVLMKALLFLLLTTLQAVVAFGEESNKEIQIFEVRKMLQMTSKDPIIRDYYVNAGQNQGLKDGALVNVFRKAPLADPYKQETQAHVELPVGVMKIIFSDKTMSIGRIQSLKAPVGSPVLEGDIFMVGDRVDMGTIRFSKLESNSAGEATNQVVSDQLQPVSNESKTEGNVGIPIPPAPQPENHPKTTELPELQTPKRKSASISDNGTKNPIKSVKTLSQKAKPVEIITK